MSWKHQNISLATESFWSDDCVALDRLNFRCEIQAPNRFPCMSAVLVCHWWCGTFAPPNRESSSMGFHTTLIAIHIIFNNRILSLVHRLVPMDEWRVNECPLYAKQCPMIVSLYLPVWIYRVYATDNFLLFSFQQTIRGRCSRSRDLFYVDRFIW